MKPWIGPGLHSTAFALPMHPESLSRPSSTSFNSEFDFSSQDHMPLRNSSQVTDSTIQFMPRPSDSESSYSYSSSLGEFHPSSLQTSHHFSGDKSPSLGELMVFPVVQKMFNNLTEAQRRIGEALDSQASLQQEILRLSHLLLPETGGRDTTYLK